jgi:NDP-sugar pyrophosphorylase family protein
VNPRSLTAVVMAAGQGTRLRPLTERWAKPVLPIDGRPVLATLLRELASAGFEEATVVTGHLAEQVEALVEDGSPFRLRISTVRQPEALGSADAVVRALDAGGKERHRYGSRTGWLPSSAEPRATTRLPRFGSWAKSLPRR